MRGVDAVLGSLLEFVAADACQLCGKRGAGDGAALDPVRRAAAAPVRVGPVINHPVCSRCASRLTPARGEAVAGWRLPDGSVLSRGVRYPARRTGPVGWGAPGPVRVVSAFESNDVLLAAIHRLKFSGVTSLAGPLSAAVAEAVPSPAGDRDGAVLVPVPMDSRSRRRRGFNQSELLAAGLSRHWGLRVLNDAVLKPRSTARQSLAGRNQRLSNVLGAFAPGAAGVEGRAVVVVDDLVTTGATAAAVAAALAGAASVTVACVGRAL